MEKKSKQCRNFQNFWKGTCLEHSEHFAGLRKEKSKKVRKNQTISKFFWKILGEGKGVSTMATTIFCKKGQKNSPNGTIFGKILVRRRPGFLLDRKKIEKKFKIFRPLWIFSGRYLVTAKMRSTIFPMPGRKKLEIMEKKSDYFWIFVEDTYTKPPGGNVNNNAQ